MISNIFGKVRNIRRRPTPDNETTGEPLINQLPDDILEEIFVHLSGPDLCKRALLVCKKWNELIDQNAFWTEKCLREKRLTQEKMRILRNLGHMNISAKKFYFSFYALFEKNFLSNPCGDENFKYWCFCRQMNIKHLQQMDANQIKKVIDVYKNSVKSPNKDSSVLSIWQIQPETGEFGSKLLYDQKHMLCKKFATSHVLAEKMQLVDLYADCVIASDLHMIDAKIEVSEWYAARFDCGSVYNLNVFLLSDTLEVVDSFAFEHRFEQWSDAEWKQVSHTFNVKKPTRYVLFYHSGVDTQFWADFYGAKMTNGSIRILL